MSMNRKSPAVSFYGTRHLYPPEQQCWPISGPCILACATLACEQHPHRISDLLVTGSGDGSECEPCLIQLEERLIKSYPIWFLPDLQRSGAVHLLQGKDEGNFIVRQSSQLNTRALSVRLPPDKGPYIQHYLIEIHNDGSSYSLEASENRFDTLPSLIAYYSQCCVFQDEEFWGTVMASPTASTPTAESHHSNAPTPSPRPHDLSFSSFGKGGVTRGTSSTSLLSPQTLAGVCASGGSLGSSVGGSTSPLTPIRQQITSPQSTPCTPCGPSTPLGEEGMSRGRNEVRRHSRLGGRGKPIVPPRIGIDSHASNGDQSADIGCHLASSWEYHLHGSDTEDISGDAHSIAPSSVTRISEYDNVGSHGASFRTEDQHQKAPNHKTSRSILPEERIHPPLPTHYFPSTVSDSGTEFSEPWDSRKWEPFMHSEDDSSVDHYPRSLTATPALCTNTLEDSDMGGAGVTDTDSFVHVIGGENVAVSDDDDAGSISGTPTLSLAHAHNLDTQQRSRIMSPQLLALRHRQDAENGVAIRAYAVDLGNDTSTTFSQAVSNFITCTLESPEKDPAIVTRNVRQFMSGMKNYLVTSGEKEFEAIVKKQQSNLKATEFLNLDAILEDVLVRLVLRPLWNHINKLFVDAYSANGSIQQLATNMKYARSQQYIRLGIKAELSPPSGASLDTIRSLLTRMQKVYAPREKLESLLATISHIYQAMYENGNTSGSGDADDLVPMIMWVLCQSGMVSAEVEADYMWGLLLPSASSGEASYYLEAFHSAIHALKNLAPSPEPSPGNSLDSVKPDVSVVSDQGIMKIVIPDEKNGSIVTRTLPIRPATTTREVCKMMAHKLKVTNPQDYGLYKLVDGLESLLADNECPHKVKSDLSASGFHCTFAFKRMDAKIAWPILT
ncbi:Protein sprint [Portunus trituberculatus]|uniref:Protein sprint n=1 Tax=Portunus trituberculatus TaxID=210409 RepID=A0A5B7D5U0_PORTR|nr:Protein sprint [Portunus trituberculatus]